MKAQFPVAFLCDRMGVSRSRYYASLVPVSLERDRRRGMLTAEVLAAFAESRQAAGYRKITAALIRKGIPVNRKTVNSIMAELGLVCPAAVRQFRRSRRRAERLKDPGDFLDRDFTSIEPGRLLVGDITYVPTGQGWLYVATVIDLASRGVLGYATGARQGSALVVEALRNAKRSGIVPAGAVFHSDHGTQYRSKRFADECGRLGIRRSMGARFECWDNAAAETFFSKLKAERLDWIRFPTRAAAAAEVADYILHFNTRRLHQTLGYQTPMERIIQLDAA